MKNVFTNLEYLIISLVLLMLLTYQISLAQCSGSCTYTITADRSTNLNVEDGERACIIASTGDIDFSGGLSIRGGAIIDICTSNGYEVTFSGGVFTQSSPSTDNREININGKVSFTGSNRTFTNTTISSTENSVIDFDQDLTLSTNSSWVVDESTLNVTGRFVLSQNAHLDIDADSEINVGSITTNDNSTFTNKGSINSLGDASFSGTYKIIGGGVVTSDAQVEINGIIEFKAGQIITEDLTVNSASFLSGDGNECGSIIVKNESILANSSIDVTGSVVLTDSTNANGVDYSECGDCGFILDEYNSCSVVLPVELVFFKVDYTSGQLKWKTSIEKNNQYFEIQESKNLTTFNTIGIVKGAGNSDFPIRYSYKIPEDTEEMYYRLRQVDYDGTSSLSDIVYYNKNKDNKEFEVEIFPNPVQSNGEIKIKINPYFNPNDLSVTLTDYLGKKHEIKGSNKICLSNYSEGVYILTVKYLNHFHREKILIIK